MRIDYKEFKKIKTKNDLYRGKKLKYPIDILINNNFYLHHVLIKLGKLELLDKINLPVYKINFEGYDGFRLAADLQDTDTLIYLIKKYPKYVYNTDTNNGNWINFVNIEFIEKIVFHKDLTHIDWKRILTMEENINNVNTLQYIFGSKKKKLINKILDKYVYNNLENLKQTCLFILFNNEIFSNNEIIIILKNLIKQKIKFTTPIDSLPPQSTLFLRENKKIVDILSNYKKETNSGEYGNIYNSKGGTLLFYLYNNHLDTKFMKYFFLKFKQYLQINEKDIFNQPILIPILEYEIDGYVVKDITNYIFKNVIKNKQIYDITQTDSNRQSILHLLVQLPFNNYKKYHSKIDFEKLNYQDKYGNLPVDYTNDKKWINKLSKIDEINPKNIPIQNNEKVNLIKIEKAYGTFFKAFIEDIGLYFYFLSQKYPRLYIPNPKTHIILKNLLFDGANSPHPFLDEFHEFAWIVIYQKKDITYVHPYLDMLLKAAEKSRKYDYSALLLSFRTEFDGLHATPLFIDFKKKELIRWDSFGFDTQDTSKDNFIKTEIADKLGYKYIPLSFSQNAIGIQEKTLENERQNIKRGDFGGFCAAWTIWFIEHKIINSEKDTKKLVNKLEKNIYSIDKPINYIRNYSNYLFEGIKLIFKKNKWDLDDYTNDVMSIELEDIIFDFLIKNL
tara:strand:- start:535 stop:2553 length:2019 start_codon:yes stop_codon:yes gene_type:complete